MNIKTSLRLFRKGEGFPTQLASECLSFCQVGGPQ